MQRLDTNLDGEFNSTDLVNVLSAGQYEDGIPLNSVWATGDWDGDGEFTRLDLVVALADGGYEQGLRLAPAAVPEPSSGVSLLIATLLTIIARRRPIEFLRRAIRGRSSFSFWV